MSPKTNQEMSQEMTATQKVALVTGGGKGIGAACCQALAGAGMKVIVHCNQSEQRARDLASTLPDAMVVCADLCQPDQVEALVKGLKKSTDRLDVLVNNAGVNRNGLIPRMNLADYDAVSALTRSTWLLTRLVLRHFMMRADSGRIVNISSVVAHTGNAGQIPYTMAKAGIDAMTRSLAQELAGRNILVNSVAPGFIDTEMTRALDAEDRERILARVPLQRAPATSTARCCTSTEDSMVAEMLKPTEGLEPAEVLGPTEVLAALPQQPPFRFVDAIEEISEEHIVGSYTFTGDEFFYAGHFPGNPITPGVILVETMAQIGVVALGLYLAANTGKDLVTLFSEANVEFLGVVRPGQTVAVRAERVYFRHRKLKVRAEMHCEGVLVCTADLAGIGVSA
jgi:3-oxoacyl-[acyl-carrier protein] reductase